MLYTQYGENVHRTLHTARSADRNAGVQSCMLRSGRARKRTSRIARTYLSPARTAGRRQRYGPLRCEDVWKLRYEVDSQCNRSMSRVKMFSRDLTADTSSRCADVYLEHPQIH